MLCFIDQSVFSWLLNLRHLKFPVSGYFLKFVGTASFLASIHSLHMKMTIIWFNYEVRFCYIVLQWLPSAIRKKLKFLTMKSVIIWFLTHLIT